MTHDSDSTIDFPVAGGRPPHAARLIRTLLVAGIVLAEGAVLLALGCQGPLMAILIMGGLFFVVLSLAAPAIAWLAVVAAAPFSIEILIPGTGAAFQAPTEPMILLLAPLWILGLLQGISAKWPPRHFMFALLGIAIVPFVSCIYSVKPGETFKVAANLTSYAVFGVFLCCSAVRNIRDLGKFAAVYAVPAMLVSVYFLFNLARTGLHLQEVNAAARPFFNEHGTFAAYLCFAFPMAVVSYLWADKTPQRIWSALVALLVLAGIVLSLTRAAWLGLLGIIMAVAFYYLSHSRNGKAWGVGVVILVVAVAVLMMAAPNAPIVKQAISIGDTKSNVSNLERFTRWVAAIDMFRDHPLGGVGYGAYKYNFGEYRRIQLSTTESGPNAGAHSLVLSILSETGIAGGIVNLVFLLSLLSIVKRSLAGVGRLGEEGRRVEQMALALAAGLFGFAIHGIFNFYHNTDKVNVPLWTFMGALVVCAALSEEIKASTGNVDRAS